MEKKKKNLFLIIVSRLFLFLFVCYFVLYISYQTGYYEYKSHKGVELTNKKIEKFEKDVKNGKNINLKDYIDEQEVSYQNLSSNVGLNLSNGIEQVVTSGVDGTFSFLEKLFQGK